VALIILGAGQEQLKNGRSDAQLDQALLDATKDYTAGCTVTLKHVSSARQMTDLIAGGHWDVIVYLGHGVINAQELDPGHDASALLTKGNLASALQKAKPTSVYLLGCSSGATGLARGLSKTLKGTSVYGETDILEVKWQSTPTKNGTQNSVTWSEKPVEYVDGKLMQNGKPAARRPHEMNDPISTDAPGGPFDDSVPND
jgi:hypothetical protein